MTMVGGTNGPSPQNEILLNGFIYRGQGSRTNMRSKLTLFGRLSCIVSLLVPVVCHEDHHRMLRGGFLKIRPTSARTLPMRAVVFQVGCIKFDVQESRFPPAPVV